MALLLAYPDDRALVAVTGPDAGGFLDNLVTVDIDDVVRGGAGFGALLTPQGKIIADFVVVAEADGFLLDLPAATRADMLKRLALYKLRAKVTIADVSTSRHVEIAFDADGTPVAGDGVADPRHAGLGRRRYPAGDAPAGDGAALAAFEALRIRLGVPEGGRDFVYGDAFPHETAMDQLAGVDFAKGCYVGQEVVSRMQHRGTARKRPVRISAAAGELPAPGAPITAGGRGLGTLGSAAGGDGVAILRLDRASAALGGGETILAGETPVTLALPGWAGYGWPEPTGAAEGAAELAGGAAPEAAGEA
ncbi:CAF17-like 4Fe-4S cluster assembly/insertion protein YgfZ [Methylobrevis albus]|uniref:Folate-binding protein YgfZ n=1 Tax=Methylobrevis albus TaxID=2793297 RepID=A0A931I1D9_9HYPH|nr:folate-binding protein YgfZ [Methylobrevis albus]MBH0238517.1 folate-binding protein YgfZ [Methylobrevis albus]